MKRSILYLLAAIIASCSSRYHPSFDSTSVASNYLLERAIHPENFKVLSCRATLNPDITIVSTEYHIAAVDGEPISNREWKNVTAVYTDSIRISHVHKPEHYYCYATVECMTDCGDVLQGLYDVAVFPDGSAIMYETYKNRYYKSIIDTVYAHRDTLTDVRDIIGYLPEWNGWLVQQMLLNFHAQTD